MTETTTNDAKTQALAALYRMLSAPGRKTAVRDMSPEDRAAYNRDAQRRHRAKAKASEAAGRPEATEAAIRTALADAAILLLAVGGPGADAIERAVGKAFPGRYAVAGTVRMRARAGTLRPKVLRPERLAERAS